MSNDVISACICGRLHCPLNKGNETMDKDLIKCSSCNWYDHPEHSTLVDETADEEFWLCDDCKVDV